MVIMRTKINLLMHFVKTNVILGHDNFIPEIQLISCYAYSEKVGNIQLIILPGNFPSSMCSVFVTTFYCKMHNHHMRHKIMNN